MRPWLEIPTKTRIGLLREYKKMGYSYTQAINDFETSLQKLQSGGLLETSSMLSVQEIPQNNLGMTGMMKGTIAREAHFGNPAAQRMISSNPKTGMTPEGQGTHYMGSYGKYAIPKLQDTGQDSLQYYPNKPPLKEAIKFNTEKEAEYFAENYKDVAPMMRILPKYEDGGLLETIKANLNPKNWGVTDYTDKEDFDTAYSSARKAGEKEFMWNNKRFNTLNSGTATQQYSMYGNTNNQILSNADEKTKLSIIQDSYSTITKNIDPEKMDRRFVVNSLAGSPSYNHPKVHPIKEVGYNELTGNPNKFTVKELMDEYKKQATFNIRPHYNSFTNKIYGNNKIAEEAHGYRNEQEGSEVISFIKSYIKHPYFSEKGQLKGYSQKEHFEYDTHEIVQPILESYLSGEIEKEDIPKYIDLIRRFNQNQTDNGFNAKENLFFYYPFNEKSSSSKIRLLQKKLSDRGYKLPMSTKKDGTFDGVWGDETKNALIDWQNKNKQIKPNLPKTESLKRK